MSHQATLEFLALTFLVMSIFVVLVDMAVEMFGWNPAVRMKWSSAWYVARYIGFVCGVLLALDTLDIFF